jgi:hypothetical protein
VASKPSGKISIHHVKERLAVDIGFLAHLCKDNFSILLFLPNIFVFVGLSMRYAAAAPGACRCFLAIWKFQELSKGS